VIDVLPGQGEVVFRHDEEDHAVSHGVHHTAPDPTRPDPTRKVGVGVGEGAHARTNEGQPDDDDHDDEELNQVQALMAAAGRPVGREDAAKIRDAVIAKGGQVRNRRSFIGKVLGDQRQARGYAPGAGTAPTVKDIIADAHRPGGPSAEVADRAMEARKALANRPRPPGAEARDGDRSPTRGAHFEELAAAQLAEARAARAVIEPGPEPAADPETPDAEPGGEPEAEDADDDEFVPPF
jgi:hypothetical protein